MGPFGGPYFLGSGMKRKLKYTTEEWKAKAIEIFGDRFDYSESVLTGLSEPITILCKEHNIKFQMQARTHLDGRSGCKECRRKGHSSNTQKFLAGLAKNRNDLDDYDLSNIVYKNNIKKVHVICLKHGDFWARPAKLLQGTRCPECAKIDNRLSIKELFERCEKVHGDTYDYSLVNNYTGYQCSIDIICKKHGEFRQKAGDHLAGNGCPICCEPRGEFAVRDFLKNNGYKFKRQAKFDDCIDRAKLSFDFMVMHNGIDYLIEFQGSQHFKPKSFGSKEQTAEEMFYGVLRRDNIKRQYCYANDIPLLEISYEEVDRIPEILTAYLGG
jgi:hypothetical protein